MEEEALKELGNYVQGHDLLVKLPGATLNFSPRHLDDNELTMTLKFNERNSKAPTVVEGNCTTSEDGRFRDTMKIGKGKGKSVPLQAWSGPEGSRKLRFPDFTTTAQDGGKVVSLMHRPHLPPGNTPGTHFC